MTSSQKERRGTLIWWAVFAAAAIGFFVLLLFVKGNLTAVFDDAVRQFFYGLRQEWLTPIVIFITYLGNWQTVTILCLALLCLKHTRLTYGLPVSVGAVFVTILNRWIKGQVQRPRPDQALHLIEQGGFSFPSGHAITSMLVYGLLICLVRANVKNKRMANILTAVLAIPMIFVGLSRIYLGVHYPTDVLAGWSLGIAAIVLLFRIFHRISVKEDTL